MKRYPGSAAEEKRKEEKSQKNKRSENDGKGEKGRGLGLQSIRAALSLVWGSKHLAELQDRLNNYREEISLRLLLVLNSNQRVQSQTLDQLKQGNEEIVEVLTVQCNTLRLKLDQDHQQYTKLIETSREEAERRHSETIAAILTSRDGQSTTLAPLESSNNDDLFKDSVQTGQKFVTRTFCGKQKHGHYTEASAINLKHFTNQILDALEFREMGERQAGVAKAYDHTFEWIFDHPQESEKPWDNITEWLESGTGIYWINGKAGSGKSTLMKYITGHKSTQTSLKQWCKKEELLVGTFYFWYAGTKLQRSQIGLLRSLLLHVLRHKWELVPVLFPNVIRALQSGQQAVPLELKLLELQYAFQSLVQTDLLSAKVCFIIDGLDEYDGDHDDLVHLFAQVTRSDKVKILVSSRPIPACVYAFSRCQSLRLQDLTFEDIRYFADNELSQHPLMHELEIETPGATDDFVQTIASRALGVFLWVSVVVKLLIRGLRDYDTVADLHRKIDNLPEELEELYSHMLRSMSKVDRAQGSKFLQLVLKSARIQGHFPMTALQLSFAEEEDYDRGFGEPPYELSERDQNRRLEKIEGRLRSRCCGLVEVYDPEDAPTRVVGFLHRTVVEFLEDANHWKEILSWAHGNNFDSTKALLYSSVAELRAKLLLPEARKPQDESIAFRAMARLLTYEITMDTESRKLCSNIFLPEAMRILFSTWSEDNLLKCSRLGLSTREMLLVTAATHCTEAQLQSLLDVSDGSASPYGTELVSRAQVVAYLLSEYVDQASVPARVTIVRGIAACHGNPNYPITFRAAQERWNHRYKSAVNDDGIAVGWTVWEFFLHYMHNLMTSDMVHVVDTGLFDTVLDTLISLIEDGANRKAKIMLVEKKYRSKRYDTILYDASDIIESFCYRMWDLTEDCSAEKAHKSTRLTSLADKLTGIELLFTSSVVPPEQLSPTKPRSNKKYTAEFANASTSTCPPGTTWSKAPWKDHILSNKRSGCNEPSSSPEKQNRLNQSATAQEGYERRRWEFTRPSERLSLLDEADRDMVMQLAQVNLTAKEQRRLFTELMRRPSDERKRLLDCVETEKVAKKSIR